MDGVSVEVGSRQSHRQGTDGSRLPSSPLGTGFVPL